jgi:hypothetical protein
MSTKKKTKTRKTRTMSPAEKLTRSFAQLLPLFEKFNDDLASIGDSLPQELQSFALTNRRLKDLFTTTDKNFATTVLKHKEAGGVFEKPLTEIVGAPSVALSFKETIRRTPRWKEEAMTFAEELADSLGEQFDRPKAEAEVIERTEPKTSLSVRLDESA